MGIIRHYSRETRQALGAVLNVRKSCTPLSHDVRRIISHLHSTLLTNNVNNTLMSFVTPIFRLRCSTLCLPFMVSHC